MPANTEDALRVAVRLACQPSSDTKIVEGRTLALAMPRAFVTENLERIAREELNLADYWEYRRLLELAALVDDQVVRRIVVWGHGHADPDVREASDDFAAR